MTKRRPSRKTKANTDWLNVVDTRVNEERLAEFRKAYLENGLNAYKAGLAIGMSANVSRGHSHRYARLLKLEIREALTAKGYGPEKLVSLFITCLSSRRLAIRLQALDKAFKVRDDYPVPIPAPAAGPVTVIFNTTLEQYDGEDYSAPPKIIESGSIQDQPQRDAGSGTPSKAITRRGLRDPEEGGAQAR